VALEQLRGDRGSRPATAIPQHRLAPLTVRAPTPSGGAKLPRVRRRGVDELLELQVAGERLGQDDFLRTTFGFDPPLEEIPRVQVEPIPPPLERIFSASDATPIATAYRRHGYTLSQIARHVGCSYSTVSRRLRREEAELAA